MTYPFIVYGSKSSHCARFVESVHVLFPEGIHLCGCCRYTISVRLGQLCLWNGVGRPNDKIDCGLFWSTSYGCVCVCFCLSMSVGTMALLRCWESQAPWCLACWTGVSKGTFGWIRWPLCPFQVWLLHDRTSNMNLEAIKDGWIAGCPPPPPPHSLHTNYTGLLVLSIICDTFCADGTVILFQCAISLVQGICVLTHQSKIH